MSRQPMRRLGVLGRATIGVLGVATALLLAPVATAQPEVEANDAITAAWQAGGGDTGPLGPKSGDVYPAGEGFAQNFASGRMFFTPDTGAHYMQGAILDKYESLGGAADSDLGFPIIDEGPGQAPGSRNSILSAPDNPVIFWTPDTGAQVVRGAINAAWDQLGGSSGVLGVPTEDETYDGAVVTQKFSGGQLTYDSRAETFTTVPPELADQLTDLSVPNDPISAINAARRAAGGPLGPLGAAEGEPYPIGDDGMGQDFVNGKIFYSPDTGANVVTGQVLAKYESVGGPEGDLGFPVTSEMDGGLAPASRMSKFAAEDNPVIFWTPDYGAFIVRGPIYAAWDKLGGATGELGAPVADQTQDGNVLTQRFSGGAISWDTEAKTFSTEPASLASQLAGLEVPEGEAPAAPPPAGNSGGDEGTGFSWTWWWLLAIVPIVLLVAVVAFAVMHNRRRERGEDPFASPDAETDDALGYAPEPEEHNPDATERGGEDALFGDRYAREGLGSLTAAPGGSASEEPLSTSRSFWGARSEEELTAGIDVEQEDPDAVDTAPTRIPTPAEVAPSFDAVDEPTADVGYETDYEADYEDEVEPLVADDLSVDPESQTPAEYEAEEPMFDPLTDTGRHARIDVDEPTPLGTAVHMALPDARAVPDGYPIKADTQSGMYWAPGGQDYDDVPAEIYFASEEMARTMGFVRAD